MRAALPVHALHEGVSPLIAKYSGAADTLLVARSVLPHQARNEGELFSAGIMAAEQVQRIDGVAQCGKRGVNRGRGENIGWRDLPRDARR